MSKSLRISKVREVKDPQRGTAGSAGIDFFVPNDYQELTIRPQTSVLIPSGIKASVPDGYALVAMNKSGVATKHGLIVGACVVDSDYQGEIHIHLINTTDREVGITPGQKVVQFLLLPVEHCGIDVVSIDELYSSQTSRGAGGFGSTGTT